MRLKRKIKELLFQLKPWEKLNKPPMWLVRRAERHIRDDDVMSCCGCSGTLYFASKYCEYRISTCEPGIIYRKKY